MRAGVSTHPKCNLIDTQELGGEKRGGGLKEGKANVILWDPKMIELN